METDEMEKIMALASFRRIALFVTLLLIQCLLRA